jgi:hypothetical protein
MIKKYPAVVFIARYGRAGSLALGILAGVYSLTEYAMHPDWIHLLLNLIASAVLWGCARLAVEIVEVVADTLLPR